MGNGNVARQRQNRSRGKCWGCGREGVELLSSVRAEGAQQRICDACRKAIANHRELDPVALLVSRRQPGAHLVTRGKLFTLNTRLTGLINALHKIGADEQVRDQIRALVEPFLSPIADDIWPKGQRGTAPGPDDVPNSAPIGEGATETIIPEEEPRKPKPKKETTPENKARKARNQRRYLRRKKGLARLPADQT